MAVLEINDLKKSYSSPTGEINTIVNVRHFRLETGELLALHGESGSGKTTFLNMIAGILEADSGEILISGKNINAVSESKRDEIRAKDIGYIFQTFNLLQGFTALENVLLGMAFNSYQDKDFAQSLLEQMGLKDRMNYKPSQLSVGQQQRVAVARALVKHPKLVLADEPTGNLDFRMADEAVGLIRETCLKCGSALLLVSHDEKVLKQFDHVKELSEINNWGN